MGIEAAETLALGLLDDIDDVAPFVLGEDIGASMLNLCDGKIIA